MNIPIIDEVVEQLKVMPQHFLGGSFLSINNWAALGIRVRASQTGLTQESEASKVGSTKPELRT